MLMTVTMHLLFSAKAMLLESPKLLPGKEALVNKLNKDVIALVRLPDMFSNPETLLNDAKTNNRKYAICV